MPGAVCFLPKGSALRCKNCFYVYWSLLDRYHALGHLDPVTVSIRQYFYLGEFGILFGDYKLYVAGMVAQILPVLNAETQNWFCRLICIIFMA